MNIHKQTLLPEWSLWPSRLVFIATTIFISQQMLTSSPVSISISVWDKFMHFGAWGLLVTLGYCSCRSQQHFIILSVNIFLYSVFIEILQPLVAQRFFDVGDILANGLGCLTAVLLVPTVDKWLAARIYR